MLGNACPQTGQVAAARLRFASLTFAAKPRFVTGLADAVFEPQDLAAVLVPAALEQELECGEPVLERAAELVHQLGIERVAWSPSAWGPAPCAASAGDFVSLSPKASRATADKSAARREVKRCMGFPVPAARSRRVG